ncbi:amino acid adenylation domain-containing protein [Dyella kyungheensis]|uniref:amino acid adenylation domain-containing protein n=1 Tax=Dyella kyungheensis TaxID=1242174 RepID=UPI003CF4312D
MSRAQRRLWFIDQASGGSVHYNMPGAWRVDGHFDEAIAECVLSRLIGRHEPLRTVFVAGEQGPQQRIRERFEFSLALVDLRGLDAAEQAQQVATALQAEACLPFDLGRDLMLRAGFLRLGEDTGVLYLTLHHIAADAWSVGVLVQEFAQLYAALTRGEADPLPALTLHYADYAHWQEQWLQGARMEPHLAYWERQLADLPALHGLPLDRPRPATQGMRGGLHVRRIDGDLLEGLRQLARREQVSLFMLLHAVFSVLLSRHANQTDIVIGMPVAHRVQRELEGLVGFFVNTLVLRTACDGAVGFRTYLQQVKQVHGEAQAHQEVSFEQLVERLRPPRSAGHTPLFQIMLNMIDGTQAGTLTLPGMTLQAVPVSHVTAKFDLSLDLVEQPDALSLQFTYSSDLFDAATIARLGEHLQTLLQGVVATPDAAVHALPMLSEAERHHLLHDLNAVSQRYPRHHCLHALIEAQVDRTPAAIAVACEGQQLTYAELDAQANRLAHHLRARGVGPDVRVGLHVERSLEMVVGILAILKAGGAYVPLDPEYPVDRLRAMLDDSAPAVVLTQAALRDRLPATSAPVLRLDADAAVWQAGPSTRPDSAVNADHLAYVIYTSGSTGKPKGVMNAHGGVAHRLLWARDAYALGSRDRILQKTPYSFDVSVWDLLLPLMAGSRLVMAKPGGHRDPHYLAEVIEREGITLIHFVPSMLQLFLEQAPLSRCRGLKYVLCSGEALPHALQSRFEQHFPHVPLHNLYGPTETAIHVTSWICRSDAYPATVPIGPPVGGARAYLLDAHQQPVPFGTTGELYIGGVGVARGYLNLPELTAERFVHDPFNPEAGARMYRTGDLARWLPGGVIDYLGRNDAQIKLRGFRIELGEVEHQLANLSEVAAAAAIVREDVPGQRRLVAYVVPHELPVDHEAMRDRLRAGLRNSLPEYMLPSAFVLLDAMPLGASGKVDRKALSIPLAESGDDNYQAPATSTEIALARIWAGVLECDPESVSATANFFENGGHSLLLIKLLSQVRAQWQVELSIQDSFGFSHLRSMAEAIDRGSIDLRPPILAQFRNDDTVPVSLAQRRLWFIDQASGGSVHYNMPGAWRVDGHFDEAIAERVLSRLIGRHEPLRTVFVAGEQGPQQRIRERFEFSLALVDLRGLDAAEQAQQVATALQAEACLPFDLGRDLMLRAGFLRLGEDTGVLYLTLHHIAADAWSVGVLVQEFAQLYAALTRGEADPLPALTLHYADYAHWQEQWLQGARMEPHLAYWERQLADLPALHGLPLDRPRPATQGMRGGLHVRRIDGDLLEGLRQLARREQVSLFMLLHAVFSVLLSRHANQTDIVIGMPVAHRVQRELEGLVGFFVNTLVLRTACDGAVGFRTYLQQVKQVHGEAQAHQEVSFEQLVERLRPPRSAGHTPLFQIMLNMIDGTQAGTLTLPGMTLQAVPVSHVTAKFDLSLDLVEQPDALSLQFTYSSDLFDAATIARLGEHLQTLLQGVVATPDAAVHALPMLSEAERHHLLHDLNAVSQRYPRHHCLHALIEAQVDRTPAAIAVACEGQQLTYAELDAQANRLAHHLRARGVGPDVRVGLHVERSLEMVVGILAILKAGGAYVPLDPEYPVDRLRAMLDDSAPAVVLTQAALRDRLPATSAPVLRLDADAAVWQAGPSTRPDSAVNADHLAYVIYTSGSTGKPKGVMNAHGGVAHRLLWARDAYALGSRDRILQKTPYSFDVSVWDLLLPLMAGSRLVMAKPGGHRDPHYLAEVIEREGITLIHFVPSMLQLFLEQAPLSRCRELQHVICIGEALSYALQQRFLEALSSTRLHNLYGPTEAAIHVTAWECGNGEHVGIVPIGRPNAEVRIYLLDANAQPVPFGTTGELYIGGVGVARGYLNLPELTAERFVHDPFNPEAGARMYRTGDLARWLPGGVIDYLGRNDAQIKLRGFRIELGEVEYQLANLSEVAAAAAIVREDVPGQRRLVAYVVPHELPVDHEAMRDRLRAGLRNSLPEYMLPSAFVLLDAMPLGASGKVDRKALPLPELDADQVYVAPRTETERALCEIWADILKRERVGVEDNFFDLGGDSILSIRIVAQLSKRGIRLDIKDIFQYQTVAQLALCVDDWRQHKGVLIDRSKIERLLMRNRQTFTGNYAEIIL